MAEQWNRNGYNVTIRLGHTALRAHALLLAKKVQSIQRMMHAQTKALRTIPGSKRKFEEAEEHLQRMRQIIKDSGESHG